MFKKKEILALILVLAMSLTIFTGCGDKSTSDDENSSKNTTPVVETTDDTDVSSSTNDTEEDYNGKLVFDHSMELIYAKNFTVDYYKGGYKIITLINDTEGDKNYNQKILVVPENMDIPEDLEEDTIIAQQPIDNMLIASSTSVSLINALGKLDTVSMVTIDVDGWYLDNVVDAMNKGDIKYIGKYKEPDYEIITSLQPDFTIFSTMLLHVPEVGEKLHEIDVDYALDEAAYEKHPMARSEAIKFWGALLDCDDKADEIFTEQNDYLNNLDLSRTNDESTVIFYVSSKGTFYVRKAGDYMAQMLTIAGGNYLFPDMGIDETGSAKMTMEEFYAEAQDVDNIIYVWSLGGKPATIDDLIAKNELLADIKAVKNGNVYCFKEDFFQSADDVGQIIKDINTILTTEDDSNLENVEHLFKLAN